MLVNTFFAFHSFGIGLSSKKKVAEHQITCARKNLVIYNTFQLLTLLSFHLTRNSRFSKIRWALLSYASPSASITYLLGSTFCKVNALWKKGVLAVAIPVATFVMQLLQVLVAEGIAAKIFKVNYKKDPGRYLAAIACSGLDHFVAYRCELEKYLQGLYVASNKKRILKDA